MYLRIHNLKYKKQVLHIVGGQRVNVLDFMGHRVSVAIMKLQELCGGIARYEGIEVSVFQ